MRMIGSHFDFSSLAEFEAAFDRLADSTDEECEKAWKEAQEQCARDRAA